MQGTVRWFQAKKGFGFIGPDEGGDDIFCHHTGITMTGYRQLREGQRVEFDVEQGPKGVQACNVVVIGE